MEPQDIDKLFGERLKHAAPTPPGDLWNRLQGRIETEMPAPAKEVQLKEEPKPFRMWISYYSIAAAIALLLASGAIFHNLRSGAPAAQQVVAQKKTTDPAPQAQNTIAAAATTATTAVAAATEAPEKLAAPATSPPAPAKSMAKAAPRATADKQAPETLSRPVTPAPVRALATNTPALEAAQPAAAAVDATLKTVSPVVLASAQTTAQPVEIIIKRSSAPQEADDEEAEEELSGFEKKQRLAKGIFRQARNLTNGERVDLSDIGINANRIAFETQIGKQKISKVINL